MERSRYILKHVMMIITLHLFSCGVLYAMETAADEISFNLETNTCILYGNAMIKYDGKTFKANVIIVHNSTTNELPPKIEATGVVRFNCDDITITAETCQSDMKSVSFEHNVCVNNDDIGDLKADKMQYDMLTKKIVMTADNVVKMTVNKNQEEKIKKQVAKCR